MHVYWKQDNVYVSAEYKEGQEIRVIVYENNQKVILDRNFYIVTGFGFHGVKGSNYVVRFLGAGTIPKLVSMLTSSITTSTHDKATKEHLDDAHEKVDRFGN